MILESLSVTQGDQQVKTRMLSDVIQQFHSKVLNIGDDEGPLAFCGAWEDLLCQFEHFLTGGSEVASAAGVGQANRLASLGVQEEKRLGLLGREPVGLGTALDHVALGVTDQAMRIQRQNLAWKIAAGSSKFAQGQLQVLSLLDGMGF